MALKLRRRWNNVRKGLEAGAGELGYQTEIGTFDGYTVAYRRGTADESVIAHSFDRDIFYNGVPEYRPGSTDVIIDIGAHIGTFSLLSARLAPKGRVIAAEASRETYNFLRINAALNTLNNLTSVHCAVTDKRGVTRLFHDRKNWGHSVMAPLSRRGEDVPTMSLANLMTDENIDRVDLIKFNCEGAEFPIVAAASDDLLARVRRLLILFHADLAHGYRVEDLQERLLRCGYRVSLRNVEMAGQRGWLWAER